MSKNFLKLAIILMSLASLIQLVVTIYLWLNQGFSWFHVIVTLVLLSLVQTLLTEYRKKSVR